jgi:hypothetical protein
MVHQSFVTQPARGINYLTLFKTAFDRMPISALDAAVAYATTNGARDMDKACRDYAGRAWVGIQKRWLVGIDYCRTEPMALEILRDLPNSEVRIHAGRQVVARKLCTPILPFHPKTFLLRGRGAVAAICGSGNLSRNGLTKGHEVGNVILATGQVTSKERLVWDACRHLRQWFDNAWQRAATVDTVLPEYESVHEANEHLRSPSPTDDDCSDTSTLEASHSGNRALSPEDLRRLRVCKRLWIEAGNLHHNRGKNRPGNQLMLTPMTRVFFGFSATDLERDSSVGDVAVTYAGHTRRDCSLRFSNNAMDVLTLPVPSKGGPERYDKKNLLFTKRADGTVTLTIGTCAERDEWVKKSKAIGGYHQMTRSGRQWGVF